MKKKHKIVGNGGPQSTASISADAFRSARRARKLEALDLAEVSFPKVAPHFKLPPFHSKMSKRKPRRSIIDESLSEAKLANLPGRVDLLDKKTKELEMAKRKTIQNRKKRKREQAEKKAETERIKRRKMELEQKFEPISIVLKAKNYTKRSTPTMNQIKNYLRKEIGVSAEIVGTLTMENVCEKWGELTSN